MRIEIYYESLYKYIRVFICKKWIQLKMMTTNNNYNVNDELNKQQTSAHDIQITCNNNTILSHKKNDSVVVIPCRVMLTRKDRWSWKKREGDSK